MSQYSPILYFSSRYVKIWPNLTSPIPVCYRLSAFCALTRETSIKKNAVECDQMRIHLFSFGVRTWHFIHFLCVCTMIWTHRKHSKRKQTIWNWPISCLLIWSIRALRWNEYIWSNKHWLKVAMAKKKKMWLSQGTTESTTKALKLTNNSYREKTQPNRNLNAFKLTKVDFILQQQVQYHPPTNSHRPESIRYIVYTASIGIGICIGIGYIPNLLLLAYLACKHFQCWKPKSNVSRRATTPNWANHMTIHAIDKIHHTNGKCPLRHKRTHEIPFCTQWLFLVIYFCLPSSVLLKDKPNAIRRQFFYHPILIAMP